MALIERLQSEKSETPRLVTTEKPSFVEKMRQRVEDKPVIITGGLGAIGKATALEFAGMGAKIAIIDAPFDDPLRGPFTKRALDVAREVAGAIAKSKGKTHYTDRNIKILTPEDMEKIEIITQLVDDKGTVIPDGTRVGNSIIAPDGKEFAYGGVEPKPLVPDDINRTVEDEIEVLVIPANVARAEDAQKAVRTVLEAWGTVDFLANVAGITRDASFRKMSDQSFDEVMDTNLKGTKNLCKHVWGIMTEQKKGNIVNIGSVSAQVGIFGQPNYDASKLGLTGLTKSIAQEGARKGISVNVVHPGFTGESPMTDEMTERAKQNALSNIPRGEYAKPEEIAESIVAAALLPNTTGQQFSPNGGMYM